MAEQIEELQRKQKQLELSLIYENLTKIQRKEIYDMIHEVTYLLMNLKSKQIYSKTK